MKKRIALTALMGLIVSASADTLTLNIEGMSCPMGCVKKVEQALTDVKGVTQKKVEVGKAEITFDASKASKKDLIAAVEKAGYKVKK